MRSEHEIREIERHKYFMSEKAGHDVGWEAAERDWAERFGAPAAEAPARPASRSRDARPAEAEVEPPTATATATIDRPAVPRAARPAPHNGSARTPAGLATAPGRLRAKVRDFLARVFSS